MCVGPRRCGTGVSGFRVVTHDEARREDRRPELGRPGAIGSGFGRTDFLSTEVSWSTRDGTCTTKELRSCCKQMRPDGHTFFAFAPPTVARWAEPLEEKVYMRLAVPDSKVTLIVPS